MSILIRLLCLVLVILTAGCQLIESGTSWFVSDSEPYDDLAAQIQFEQPGPAAPSADAMLTMEPHLLSANHSIPDKFEPLTLDEAIQTALQNATVLRDLGGTILTSPELLQTIHRPALQETNPRFGVEAALSDFDAQLRSTALFEKNNRVFNNQFFGGGVQRFTQDLHDYQTQLSKQTASGTQFFLRHNVDYDANNGTGNLFGSAWNTNFETEIRQPLLQGSGTRFNRIAGPTSTPGEINGVVIARINRDIAVTDFEVGLRDFVSEVENAYWELYFAYRFLDAKILARDQSLDTWRIILTRQGEQNFEADREAQAREQYFRFEEDVKNALSGRPLDGTRTNNGSSGGTFRGIGGVYTAERRLRLLMGIPLTSEQLIKPSTEPILAPVDFNWQAMLSSSIATRPELKKQRQIVKRIAMELDANKSFLKPRLDAIAQYRWRGFGKDLINGTDTTGMGFDDAYSNLLEGDYQEWQLGVELSFPLGFRQAHAAVRHSELALAQQRAILREQEREIVHNLSNALGDLERATAVAQINYNRLVAAAQRVQVLKPEGIENELIEATPSDLLDAQTRLSDAQSRYYLALVEYMVALRNVHLEKGSLLEYRGVYLADSFDSGVQEEVSSEMMIDVTEVPDPRTPIRESYERQEALLPEIVDQPYDPQPLADPVINPVGYQTVPQRTSPETMPLRSKNSFELAEHELNPSGSLHRQADFEQISTSKSFTAPATLMPQLESFDDDSNDKIVPSIWESESATDQAGKKDVIYE